MSCSILENLLQKCIGVCLPKKNLKGAGELGGKEKRVKIRGGDKGPGELSLQTTRVRIGVVLKYQQ